jgi:hypothetical protein
MSVLLWLMLRVVTLTPLFSGEVAVAQLLRRLQKM